MSATEALEPEFSPVELLHPDGPGSRRAVVGSSAAALFAPRRGRSAGAPFDFVLVAPDAGERRDRGFIRHAAAFVSGSLSADGLAYVLAPASWRRRLRRQLRNGFRFGPTIAHLPPSRPDQFLVPVESRSLRYTVAALTGLTPRRRTVLGLALRWRGVSRVLAALAPEAGLVVRRAGARPLLEWIAVEGEVLSGAVIRTKWRAQRGGTAVLYCFTSSGQSPAAIAKVALQEQLAGRAEAEALAVAALAPAAVRAGIRAPIGRLIRSHHGHSVLVEGYLEGRRAYGLLNDRSIDAPDLLSRLTGWLKAWNAATLVAGVLDEERLEAQLLAPARRLAPFMRNGARYVSWLEARAAAARGQSVPLVATHNDLTMQNVLLHPGYQPAVVDWEAASADGLPMTDFFYMAVDLFAATGQLGDRATAFEKCFLSETRQSTYIAALGGELASAVELSADSMLLCFHACWLHHASNEVAQKRSEGPRLFLAILKRLADHPAGVRFVPRP